MKVGKGIIIAAGISVLFGAISLLNQGCNTDMLEPLEGCEALAQTYEGQVKEIIDQTCAYSGCHDGAGGIAPGNYRSFEGLRAIIQDGSFVERTIDQRDNPSLGMPPDQTVYPESNQDDLSALQLEIITCWIQNGFPE